MKRKKKWRKREREKNKIMIFDLFISGVYIVEHSPSPWGRGLKSMGFGKGKKIKRLKKKINKNLKNKDCW